MPYEILTDLPESVKHSLPQHGLEIYKSAYNAAHTEYFRKDQRRSKEDSLEEICHRVAWAAVKKVYHKDEKGNWILSK